MASEWKQRKWEDLATLEYGKSLRGYENGSGRFPVYGTNGLIGWHSEPLCKHPGVIVGRKGAYRGIHYSSKPFYVIDTAFYLKPKADIDLRWAYYALLTQDINAMDSGSAIPSTSRVDFYALPVKCPPPSEQQAIALVLGSLDDKIALNQRMNETLEAIARVIFKSWFVDFDPVRAKAVGRQPFGMDSETTAPFPDSFEDSPLGKIPRGFHIAELGSILAGIETGSRPKGGVGSYVEGVPSIGAESIVGLAKFDFTKTKYVPHDYYLQMTKGKVKSRDVLLYKDGGRPGVYEPHVALFGDGFPFEEACINEHVYRLRVQTPLSQAYLYFWLTSELATDEMRQKGTGVAIPGLNSTSVRSLNILVPSDVALRRYEEICEPIIRLILSNANESRILATIRDALLPKLVSGEVRVAFE